MNVNDLVEQRLGDVPRASNPFSSNVTERLRNPTVKPIVARFRVSTGERSAELRQFQRSMQRVRAYYHSRLVIVGERKWNAKSAFYSQRLNALAAENERLRNELSSLKHAITKKQLQPRELTAQPGLGQKASQFLAVLGDDAAEWAFKIFEEGSVAVTELLAGLGSNGALQLANQLGWSETGLIDGERVRTTEAGRALLKAVVDTTDDAGEI
jgi:hypothetical protein